MGYRRLKKYIFTIITNEKGWKEEIMKKVLKAIVVIFIIILAAGGGFYFGTSTRTLKSAQVTIEQGSGSRKIAKQLQKEGVIRSQAAFLVKLKFSKYNGKMRYGIYQIQEGITLNELIKQLALQGAKKNTIDVTFPEGYSLEQMGATLEKKGLFSKEEFLKAANQKDGYDFDWLYKIPESKDRKYFLQGYLYPDTYNFYKDVTPKEVVRTMLENFEQHFPQAKNEDSLDDIVTEASLLERETRVDSERAMIAGVIENRINQGMKLQIDVSVIYPLTNGMYTMNSVNYKDLKVDSPYNTYKYEGLPVGPICNPSVSSLEAAQNPVEHEYFYYHTKSKDSIEHNFYKTYEEHMQSQKEVTTQAQTTDSSEEATEHEVSSEETTKEEASTVVVSH